MTLPERLKTRRSIPAKGLGAASIAALAESDGVRYSQEAPSLHTTCYRDVDVLMSHSIPTNRRLIATDSIRWLTIAAVIATVVVVLDALSKFLITRSLGPDGPRNAIQIAGDFVELDYTRNSGVAFGLLSGSSTIAGALVGLLIVPLLFALFIFARRGPLWSVAAGLVLGGAVGNLVDRIGDRTVTDFISVGRWPSFNLADAAITVGALVLIGLSVRDRDCDQTESSR